MIFKRDPGEERPEGWQAVPASGSDDLHGKIEWDKSADGETDIHATVRRLNVPDGVTVEVVCDGEVVISARVEKSEARILLKSTEGHRVASLAGKQV